MGKYKGVSWNQQIQRWVAYRYVDGKQKHLGTFECEDQAGACVAFGAPQAPEKKPSGVSWCSKQKRWRAYVYVNRKQKHLGYFCFEQDAINAVRNFK